jgi:hypothetical protein
MVFSMAFDDLRLFLYNFAQGCKKKNGLIFFKILTIEILIRPKRRQFMAIELECPICDADIPLDGNEKSGDLILCSYCKVTFKLLKTKDKWMLSEDFEE